MRKSMSQIAVSFKAIWPDGLHLTDFYLGNQVEAKDQPLGLSKKFQKHVSIFWIPGIKTVY